MGWLTKRACDGPLSHEASWYNVDAQLEAGLSQLLAMGRSVAQGGVERAEALATVDAATCVAYGFRADAFTAEAMEACRQLGGSKATNRRAAVETLGKLAPEALAEHAAALVAKLEDSDEEVRKAAADTLGKLAPEVLTSHGGAVLQMVRPTQ